MTEPDKDAQSAFRVFNEIGIIHQLVTAQVQRLLAPDLGVSEFGVLNHFVRVGDGTTPSRLARIFQMSKPSMTAILAKLNAKGYVTVSAGTTDRRQKIVRITKDGRAAHTRAVQATTPALREGLAGFDTARLAGILPVLTDLRIYLDRARNAADDLQDGPPPEGVD